MDIDGKRKASVNALPTISVVIPCYNAERYVSATLSSVFAQDWPSLEVIVVDDGSADDSVRLIEASYPEARLVRQANGGVASARNAGIGCATGEFIAFVDADDYWLPGKLRTQWELLQANPNARMAYGAWVVWESSEPTPAPGYLATVDSIATQRDKWTGATGWIYPELLLDCEVWTSTVIAHRSLFEEVGVFDTGLRIGEDYDLWLRASRVTEILRVDRPTALYRMHVSNITRKLPARNYQAEVIRKAVERWGYLSPDGRSARPVQVRRALARTWRNFGSMHLTAGNRVSALQGAFEAVCLEPAHTGGWKIFFQSLLPVSVR